jgi:hypothetical protein
VRNRRPISRIFCEYGIQSTGCRDYQRSPRRSRQETGLDSILTLAADTEQDRYVMITSCERRSFPASMRWLNAGGDLPRPNSIHQCTDRALTRFERPPKCLLHSADLPYCRQPGSNPASVTLSLRSAPASNPHNARCPVSAQLPATSCLGAFRTPATSSCGGSRDPGVRKPRQKLTSSQPQATPITPARRVTPSPPSDHACRILQ